MSRIRTIAVMLGLSAVLVLGCEQALRVPVIYGVSIHQGDVLLGEAVIPDGTTAVWSYEVETGKFKVLMRLRARVGGPVPGSSPSTLIYWVLRLPDDAETMPTGYYKIDPESTSPLRLEHFAPLPQDLESHARIVALIRGTDYFLAERLTADLSASAVTLEVDRWFELWDIHEFTQVAKLQTHSRDERALNSIPLFTISRTFGRDTNLFLIVETDLAWGPETWGVRVFTIEPFRQIARVPEGRIVRSCPGSAPEEVRLVLDKPVWQIKRLVCLPDGDGFDVKIETVDVMSEQQRTLRDLNCRNGLKFWSTEKPPQVRIGRLGQSDPEEVIAVPIQTMGIWDFAVSYSGRLLVTREAQNRLGFWSVDFPQVKRIRSCELVYEAESGELRLISAQAPQELEQTSGEEAEADEAN